MSSFITPKPTMTRIPGGAHTYSKGDDQFPSNAPATIERGLGCHVWDDKGREYIDWAMGLRTGIIGYGIPEINNAVIDQIWKGSNFSRAAQVENDLAEDMSEIIRNAEMVKFAKNGSTVTTAAVKLARAYTGRDYVAFCKEHPFFSYDDWFIGTTPCNSGVPKAISDLSLPFHYNDIASLEAQFAAHPGQISCVIMEAVTSEPPKDDFLHKVQALCRRHGALFIIDEMITGFRFHLGGAVHLFGIEPDMTTFGKGMGNGFAVSALVGRREVMELGGITHNKPRVFLISTTHGAENHALAAGRAVIAFCRENPVMEHVAKVGGRLIEGLNALARDVQVADHFAASGYPASPVFSCRDRDGVESAAFRTLFHQEMIRQGILFACMAPSWSHRDEDIEKTLDAARNALGVYRRALDDGIEKHLVGPATKPVFRPFN